MHCDTSKTHFVPLTSHILHTSNFINMQSLAPASNSLSPFSPKHVHRLIKSNIELLPMRNYNKTGHKTNNLLTCNYMATTTDQAYEQDLRMNKYYEVELQVQEDHVYENGIVDSAFYSNYCQQGHKEMLKNVGLALGGNCKATTLSNFSSNLFTPLKLGEEFSVKVNVSCISTTSIYVETFIFRIPDNELILEADAEIVLLGENCRPVRISPGVRAKLLLLDSIDIFE